MLKEWVRVYYWIRRGRHFKQNSLGVRKLTESLELDVVNLAGVQVRDDHKYPMVHVKEFVLYFLVTVAF